HGVQMVAYSGEGGSMARRGLLIILGCLILVGPARAGLYGGPAIPQVPPDKFPLILGQLRALELGGGLVPRGEEAVRKKIDSLQEQKRTRPREFLLPDRVTLAGCFLRLGREEDALAQFKPLEEPLIAETIKIIATLQPRVKTDALSLFD